MPSAWRCVCTRGDHTTLRHVAARSSCCRRSGQGLGGERGAVAAWVFPGSIAACAANRSLRAALARLAFERRLATVRARGGTLLLNTDDPLGCWTRWTPEGVAFR